ncbi:hypothetical protein MMC10_007623 [Thelotrema lepadinum]|nr:hypothetical protein [Thelotrema lepadinum]
MPFDRSHSGEHQYKAKLVLRWITLAITTITLILTGHGDTYAWILYVPLGCSFIWNIANIARRMSAPTPIHPGANVGVDLLIWGGFLTALLWVYMEALDEIGFTADVLQLGHYPYYSGTNTTCVETRPRGGYSCSASPQVSFDPNAINGTRTAAIVGLCACALSTVVTPLHVTLFIFACVDTHRFRHADQYLEYRREPRSSPTDKSQVESNDSLPDLKQQTHEMFADRELVEKA